ALVHEELYRSTDLGTIDCQTYFQTLVASLARAYEVDRHVVSIEVEAPGCTLSIDRAIPCGLIVNELASNALKHAFAGRPYGKLSVALGYVHDANTYVLEVCDDGIGFPPDLDYRSTQTLGLKLVHSLVDQLHGTIAMEGGGGTCFRVRFSPA